MTKQERNKIYRTALDIAPSWISKGYGLCNILSETTYEQTGYIVGISKENFPEFFNFKPATLMDLCFWFPKRELEPRLEILRECIELTNE